MDYKPRFSIGDLIERRTDVFNDRSLLRVGRVVSRYTERTRFGYYPELYEVEWSDGTRERGFLPHGLSPSVDRGEERPR